MAVKMGDLGELQHEALDIERFKRQVANLFALSAPAFFSGEELLQPLLRMTTEAIESVLEATMAPVKRLFDDLFGPGTLDGDLYLVRTKADPAALERLARRLRWAPRDPRAQEAMRARVAEMGREQAHLTTFGPAMLLAVARMQEPQRIRFGREYLVGDDGQPVMMAPMHLPMPWFWRWLRKETINAMEADLLERPYLAESEGEEVSDIDPEQLATEAPDPEEALLLAEVAAERERILTSLVERCTPAERRLLAALLDGAPSLAEAARTLGILPATARVQHSNIRRKARDLAA